LQDIDASVYRCPQCVGDGDVGSKGDGVFMLDKAENLELVDTFCYLVDKLEKSGDVEELPRTRVRYAGVNSMSLF